MGRRLCAAAVSGVMRHEALTYGRAAAARPAGDGAGAAEEGRAALRRGASWPNTLRRGAVCAPTSRRVRLSVTSPPGGVGQPPASLRGTMKSGPTGQMHSSNPPPGCGGVAPGPAGLSLGPGRTERRSLGRGPRCWRALGQAGTPSGCRLWAKEVPGTQGKVTSESPAFKRFYGHPVFLSRCAATGHRV